MTIGLHTIPGGATPILDANRVILDEGSISEALPALIHPGDIPTGLNLCPDPVGGVDLILTARPNLDALKHKVSGSHKGLVRLVGVFVNTVLNHPL